jgi:hypothetical protein
MLYAWAHPIHFLLGKWERGCVSVLAKQAFLPGPGNTPRMNSKKPENGADWMINRGGTHLVAIQHAESVPRPDTARWIRHFT